MGVNKYQAHVWVLPEDDATRQLANGFILHPAVKAARMAIHQPAGGWAKVLDDFERTYAATMRKYPERRLVLLIDFDDQIQTRVDHVRARIPADLVDRVYVLGSRSEPEPLRKSVGKSLEEIGRALAQACADDSGGLWHHELLSHNDDERGRLRAGVRHILFE